ncbi:hypothetical protein [Mesobacillus foraminis]|uniref:hypothetical protein n=1 Tax=Mesobacillus foraminis TaxID=279826 RepID=UPI0013CEB54F|nr:hypothetical protein [Mesobacillus foraminis]
MHLNEKLSIKISTRGAGSDPTGIFLFYVLVTTAPKNKIEKSAAALSLWQTFVLALTKKRSDKIFAFNT